MTAFSALVRKQAGRISVTMALFAAIGAGIGLYGVNDWREEQNYIEGLQKKAEQMRPDKDLAGKMSQYLNDEQARIEKSRQSNQALMVKAKELSEWIEQLDGAPTVGALQEQAAWQYDQAKTRLIRERLAVDQVSAALNNPQDVKQIKERLTKENLEIWAQVKDCAARGAGQGAYCGGVMSWSVRAEQLIAKAERLKEDSRNYGETMIRAGWKDWDQAQASLTGKAFAEIDQQKAMAKAAFDSGQIDEDDWKEMQAGFDAAKGAAADQIAEDRKRLQEASSAAVTPAAGSSGATKTVVVHERSGMSAMDWWLLYHWMNATPSASSIQSSQAFHSAAIAQSQVRQKEQEDKNASGGARVGGGYSGFSGSGGYAGSTAAQSGFAAPGAGAPQAQAPAHGAAPASGFQGIGSKVAAAPGSNPYAAAGAIQVKAPSGGANPYAATADSSRLGAKVSQSFTRASGQAGQALSSAGGKGIGSKVAAARSGAGRSAGMGSRGASGGSRSAGLGGGRGGMGG